MKVNTECREILPGEKSGLTVTFITDVHLVPRLRLIGVTLSLPHMPLWHGQIYIYL